MKLLSDGTKGLVAYMRTKDGAKPLDEFIRSMGDAPKLLKDIEDNGGLRERVILAPLPNDKFKVWASSKALP